MSSSMDLPSREQLQATRLMVIGDLMVDHYLSGQIRRISPEAPVPVLRLESEEFVLGGAANVAKNLTALHSLPMVVGVVGQDEQGRMLTNKLHQLGLSSEGVFADPHRPTTIKTRVTSQKQQMIRIDRESDTPLSGEVLEQMEAFILAGMKDCRGIILSDYNKGMLSPRILKHILDEARRRDIRVFVDPKGRDFTRYRGASFITPNRNEAEQAFNGCSLDTEDDLERTARAGIEQLNLEGLLITLGKDGLFIAGGRGEQFQSRRIEAEEREVFDVTGAGDTVIAAFSLMLCSGLDLFEAAHWANLAAGVVVGKSGAATASWFELKNYAQRYEPWQRKVKSIEELSAMGEEAKRRGWRIVFSNGCFDLLHVGHIQLLQAARRQGDLLIIGINSDDSVRRLKGPGRPLIPEKERLQILASLDCVDYLVVYDETTPNSLIERLRPDILAKGANYTPDEVTGHEIVEQYGGRVALIPIQREISVSGLVDHIVQHFSRDSSLTDSFPNEEA